MRPEINLYDPSLRPRRDMLGAAPVLAAVAAAFVGMAIAVAWARTAVAELRPRLEREAAELQARQTALQSTAGPKTDSSLQNAIADAQRTLTQRRAALEMLASNPIDREGGFAARLEALARQAIDGLWLTGIVLRQDDVVLKGRALQPDLIPRYVQRLDREPSLQGRMFRTLDVVRPLEKTARPASAAADGEPLPAAPRSAWVEFTLSGTASASDDDARDGERASRGAAPVTAESASAVRATETRP